MGKKGEKKKKESEELPTSTIAAGVEAVRTGIDLGLDAYDTGSQFVQTIRLLQNIQNQSTVRGVIDGMNNFYRTTSGVIESGQSMLNNVFKMRDHLKNLSNVLIGRQVIPGWATLFVDSVELAKASWEQNKDLWAARGLLDGLKGSGAVLKNVFDRVDRNANHFGLTIIDGITLKASKYKRRGAWFISQMGDIIYKRGSTMSKVYGRYLLDFTPKNMERFLKIESLAIGRNRLARRQHKKTIKYKDGDGNYYRLSADGIIYKIYDAKSGETMNERPRGVVPQLFSLTQNIDSYTRYYFQLQDLFVAISESLSPGSGLTTVRAAQLEQDYHDIISKIFTSEGKMSLGSFTKAFDEVLALGLEPDELMELLLKDPKDIELTEEERKIYNLLENLRNFESGKPIKGSVDELDEAVMKLHNDNVPIISHGYFSSLEAIPALGNTYMNSLTTFLPSLVQDIGYQSLIDSLLLGGTVINTLFGRGLLGNVVGYLTCKAIKLAVKTPFKIVKGAFKLAGFSAVKAYQGFAGVIRWYQERQELEEMSRQLDELLRESEDAIRDAENVLASNQQIENSSSTEEEWFSADEYVPEPEPKKIKMDDGAEEYGEPFSNGFESQPLETNPSNIANLTEQDNQDINNELQQLEGEIIVSDSDLESEDSESEEERSLEKIVSTEKLKPLPSFMNTSDDEEQDSGEAERPQEISEEYDKYDWRWFENKSTDWIKSKLKVLKDPQRKEAYLQELRRRGQGTNMRPAEPEPTIPITSSTFKGPSEEIREEFPDLGLVVYPGDVPLGPIEIRERPQKSLLPRTMEVLSNLGNHINTSFDIFKHRHLPFRQRDKELEKILDDYYKKTPIDEIREDDITSILIENDKHDLLPDTPSGDLPLNVSDDPPLNTSPEPNPFAATHQVEMPVVSFAGANPDPNDPGSDSSSDSDDNHNFNDDNDFSDNDNNNDEFDAEDDLASIGDRSGDELNVDDVDEANINEFNVLNPLPNVVDVNIDPNEMGMRLEDFEVVPRLANDRMNHFIDAVARESGLPRGMVERVVIRIGDVPNPQTIIKVINGAKLAGNVISGALAVYDIVKAVNRMKARRQYKKFLDNVKKETERRLKEDVVFNENGKRKRPTEKSSIELITEMSQEMQDWMRSLPDKTRNEIFDAILKNKDNFKIAQDLFYQTRGYGKVNKTILKNELNTSLQGGRSLGYVPQIFSSSYLERVFKAKMANTLPVDQTEQSSVIIKEDPIQEKLDTTILEAPAEDVPGHFEVTRVDDQAIYIKPVIEANALSDKVLDEDNVPDKVLEKTQEEDFDLPEAAVSVQTVNVAPAEPLTNNSNLIQDDSFDMTLLKVKGNPKVRRCSKCNTFVSLDKTHSARECADRLAKFKASRGKKRSHRRKGKKGDVVLTKAQAKKLLKAKKKIPSALKKILQKSLK